MRRCAIPILLWIAIGCGDDDTATDTAATSATAGGAGSGGGGGDTGAGGGQPCVGCGEFITSSAPNLAVCSGGSKIEFEALIACLCEVCDAACASECAGPPTIPGCTACKLGAAQRECRDQHATCLEDVK